MSSRTHQYHYDRRTHKNKKMSRRKMIKKRRAARTRTGTTTRTRRTSITQVLPVDCIAHILWLTSPRDVCAFSMVSSTFKSAADSDHVWEKFLPLDYQDIVTRCPSLRNTQFSSVKHLFSRLCCPNLLDGGTKSLYIEKNNGKIRLMLGSKELTVNWDEEIEWAKRSDTVAQITDYWRWISLSHSRFSEAIELVHYSWLFIIGKTEIQMLSPKTTYVAYFVFKLTDYAFGFTEKGDAMDALFYTSVEYSVKFVRGEGSATGTRVLWKLDTDFKPHPHFPSERESGWIEIEMGEFYTGEGKDGEMEFTLKAEDDAHWKGSMWKRGLIVQGIELRPKSRGRTRN